MPAQLLVKVKFCMCVCLLLTHVLQEWRRQRGMVGLLDQPQPKVRAEP